jgi:predicted restriction endonuclease
MANNGWTREQLMVALALYCRIPFGKLHSRNPDIIKYSKLIGRTPDALAMKLTNIASLDPAITTTGRKGLPGASSADRQLWEEVQQDWDNFAIKSEELIAKLNPDEALQQDGSDDDEQEDYSAPDRTTLQKVRVGQRFFRKAVLSAYGYKCCMTGLSIPRLLVASHIVPWRHDIANRRNPMNGLALSMLHDKAFDLGIITIGEDMTIRVSKKIMRRDEFCQASLNIYDGKPIALPEKFSPRAEFLEHHRGNVFEKWKGIL